METGSLRVEFEARGHRGSVSVALMTNDNPIDIGCAGWALGFPICEATVDFAGRGYEALMGWVQLVRQRSPGREPTEWWETDPLEMIADIEMPFGVYGIKPTLFDAPARSDRSQRLEWHAESFLCVAPTSPMTREVMPVAAFSWGFSLADDEITLLGPESLSLSAWSQHRELLAVAYPTWEFIDPSGR